MEEKEGYRLTNIGLIPSDWDTIRLGELLDYEQPTKYITKDIDAQNGIPVLTSNKSFVLGYSSETNGVFRKTPIILFDDFTTDRKYVDFPFKIRSSATKILKPNRQGLNLKYIFSAFDTVKFQAEDHKRYWISEFQYLKVPFPPDAEQNRIVDILITWEKAIDKKELLLNELLTRRKGIEIGLFKGEIRFQQFHQNEDKISTYLGDIPSDWNLKPISEIVQKVKKPFTPEPERLYREIGIRSHCKGIFHKMEVTGASLGDKSVFWIQPDCFVVNIVFAWEHAIAKTTEAEVGMIASHRFPMYKPKKGVLDLDYLLYYFKTARGKHLLGLASPGGAGRNKTLGQGEFAKLKIPVPSLAEQKRIVSVLSEADREIELLKQQIATLKEQKKGLMQKLLTGSIRVRV
ncbi:restriction endonuclease subunit S [Algoriphagus sp. AGSA1]|uniref:restriction endonuclease subunit S n=1 Tax=Algoriphagus sp. AGSA1 TaxID=2907213 RepID=UPI001F384FCE|nr:restriction endonuclease subunit S [Algoriphagus sp. AGSA1]MCE7053895.1 restriction endonuclease subunit S [Algoriphagus sp. AGSA1]